MKKIIFWIAIGFLAIQFIPVDRENRPVDIQNNFVDIYKTPDNIRTVLRNACYDCHSNETHYPDYAYIAPISWAVKDHVNTGRDYLNFSEWGTYNQYLKNNAIQKTLETLQDRQMPLPSYISYHPAANLTTQQIQLLRNYFSTLKQQ